MFIKQSNPLLRVMVFIATAAIVASCGVFIDEEPARRPYKTLTRNSPWEVRELRIIRHTESDINSPITLDTTLYNWGTLHFEKGKFDDFGGKMVYAAGGENLFLSECVESDEGIKLFLRWRYNGIGFNPDMGSGILSDKTGKELRITAERTEGWFPGQFIPYFSPAPFITEGGYFRCEWYIVSKD